MNLKMKKIFVSWCLSILLVFAVVTGAQAYSSILAFGDSLSDNGKSATDPFGAVVCTNGYVWVDYLAQNLGVSAYYNMAFAGATTSIDAPALAAYGGDTKFGLQWQVGAYATTFTSITDNTLVTISAGGNDMFNGRNAATAAYNIAGVITYLMGIGGDAFMVMNLSPSQQPSNYQAWMADFNYWLAQYLAGLGVANPDVTLYLLDMTKFVADVDNIDDTWIAKCSSDPSACAGTTYAWWDTVGVHPTTEVHKQIGDYAAAAVPEPASIILLILGFAGLAGARRRMK